MDRRELVGASFILSFCAGSADGLQLFRGGSGAFFLTCIFDVFTSQSRWWCGFGGGGFTFRAAVEASRICVVDTSHSANQFRQTSNKYIANLTKNYPKNHPPPSPFSTPKSTSKPLFIFRLFNSESPLPYLFPNPHYNHIHSYFLYSNNFSIFSDPNK